MTALQLIFMPSVGCLIHETDLNFMFLLIKYFFYSVLKCSMLRFKWV